ncbi:DNM1L [Cordylochernes scorpioides]|uniref:DNM1L n=1 Tax=Cordylochernes scorpioides TaxID=51811 RepID=A0ABY6KF45_9ARAC|nr:DNM1L [Cordylochernes scorpioides]
MEGLIPIFNKIQDAFNSVGSDGLKLPQIIAIGTQINHMIKDLIISSYIDRTVSYRSGLLQSSGKSSILESLVGRGFLPRGHGIVTRCPLVLQLVYVSKTETILHPKPGVTEWAKFLHKGNQIYEDWDAVREEIIAQTNKLCESSTGISQVPINLKVYSHKVPTLTLVDLPGLTKVPVGDQPTDIEMQVTNLVKEYIGNPNSIILAVASANVDFATSDSLKLAKEVDPKGNRTVVVITKLDLMDEGTDATDLLSGQVIPVKLGIIGVVNRSQQDIMNNRSISDVLKKERDFLLKRYHRLANTNGTPYLAQRLTKLLCQQIKTCLPGLKSEIAVKTAKYKHLLESFGPIVERKDKIVLDLITKYSLMFVGTLNGTDDQAVIASASQGALGGAEISNIFYNVYGAEMDQINPLENITSLDILTAIKNTNGLRPTLFVPETAFIQLVSKQIKLLEAPSMNCVTKVQEELSRVASACEAALRSQLARFPNLQRALREEVRDILNSRVEPTMRLVSDLISIQPAYINTRHPDFLLSSKFFQLTETTPSNIDKRDNIEVGLIAELIKLYFRTLQRTIHDCVPKSIMLHMVNYINNHLQEELTLRILNPAKLDHLLGESPQVAEKRREAQSMLSLLHHTSENIALIKNVNL